MSLLANAQVALSERVAPARFLRDMVRYGAASAAALALDWAVLMALTKGFGVDYMQAAAAGFLSGLGLIYFLSVRYVFQKRRSLDPSAEMIGFLTTGLFGLMLTEGLMALFVESFGFSAPFAKAATAGLVFLFNFVSRRRLLLRNAVRKG